MKRKFRVVVFDLDDTLYPEADYVYSGCRAVAKAAADAGICTFGEALDTIRTAPSRAEGFDRLAALSARILPENTPDYTTSPYIASPLSESSRLFGIAEILSIYRHHLPEIKLPKDSIKALQHFNSQGISLAIITDGRKEGQWAKIEALGLREYIPEENIIVSADYSTDKFSPKPFQIVMERFPDISPADYIYIGDNPAKDFFWPNKLGWATAMLLDTSGNNIHSQIPVDRQSRLVTTLAGTRDSHPEEDFQPQFIIKSLLDIVS